MPDTTEPVETGNAGTSQTTVQPAAPDTGNAPDPEVERLRKEKEQADMRARQLENELKAKNEAEAEAKRKQLEEEAEYKTLYEKTQADLKAMQDTQEAEKRKTELTKATEEIFKEYPKEVVDLANTAGLGLSDNSEAAQTALKEKLDAFKAKVAPTTEAGGANPQANPSAPAETGQTSGLGRPRSLGVDTGEVTIQPEANKQKVHEYLDGLQSIKQMKLDSGHYKEA